MDPTEDLQSSVASLRAIARDILDKTEELGDACERRVVINCVDANQNGADIWQIYALAKGEYRNRRAREKFFDLTLLGEPAWDILLDLFVHRIEGKLVSIGSASIASRVPSTTALRWLGLLEQRRMVRRVPSPTDKRVSWIEIEDSAFDRVARVLRARLEERPKGSALFPVSGKCKSRPGTRFVRD